MILKIKIEVEDKLEAYDLVSRIGLQHDIKEAEYGERKEVFDEKNKPALFLKNNKKNISKYRSYEFRQKRRTK